MSVRDRSRQSPHSTDRSLLGALGIRRRTGFGDLLEKIVEHRHDHRFLRIRVPAGILVVSLVGILRLQRMYFPVFHRVLENLQSILSRCTGEQPHSGAGLFDFEGPNVFASNIAVSRAFGFDTLQFGGPGFGLRHFVMIQQCRDICTEITGSRPRELLLSASTMIVYHN